MSPDHPCATVLIKFSAIAQDTTQHTDQSQFVSIVHRQDHSLGGMSECIHFFKIGESNRQIIPEPIAMNETIQ